MNSPSWLRRLGAGCALIAGVECGYGVDIGLFEFALNQNGVVSTTLPAGSSFDAATGLGSIRMPFSGAGSHHCLLFVDHELSETVNTFFNELGATSGGSAPAGLSWEIDEPGFVTGDIYDHLLANALSHSVDLTGPDDVSMAMGWTFALAAGESAELTFLLSTTEPTGFSLHQWDPDSGENVYLSSSLRIFGGGTALPEGFLGWPEMAGAGLALGIALRRARLNQESRP